MQTRDSGMEKAILKRELMVKTKPFGFSFSIKLELMMTEQNVKTVV